jgi:hypothetical protein
MAIAEQQDCGGRDYTLQGSRGQVWTFGTP